MARKPKPEDVAKTPPARPVAPRTVAKEVPTDLHHDVCVCGHAKCRHDHRSGFVTGCVAPGPCPCKHFTWSHFGEETAHG